MANPKTVPKKITKAAKNQMEMARIEHQNDVNRIVGVVLFVLSILGFFVACVSGQGVWNIVHNVYVGLFGYFAAIIFPIITIVVSIIHSLKTPSVSKMISKSIEGVILVLLFSTLIHIIITKENSIMTFSQTLSYSYQNAIHSFNGGWIGAVIGGLCLTCGKLPALIIAIVLIFFDFMLLTGITLIQFFTSVGAPAKKATEKTNQYIEEKRQQKRFDIDVDLDEEPPTDVPKKSARKKNLDIPVEETSVPKDIIAEINESAKRNKIEGLASPKAKEKSIDEIVQKASENEDNLPPIEKLNVPKSAMETSLENYKMPPVDLLIPSKNVNTKDVSGELKSNAQKLIDTLHSFNVDASITDICRGPTVTRYEIKPAAGIRINKITNLADDIALSLAATHVRIEAPIPGKAAVGIEVPNSVKNGVSMRELIETMEFKNAKSKLTAGLGKDIGGNCVYADMAKMPHLLIAGTTGSGKSVCMNSIIVSMLYKATPDEVKFLMIDPKQVEFSKYSGIPHLLVPVVTDPRKAAGALGWAVSEMLQRYQKFSDTGVRDIEGYNKYVAKHDDLMPMPKIVIFIDELSDLMMAAPKEVEDSICRLAQMARAAGMHLIIATQRPSVDVITGLIKANISSRIALTVSSQIDSRTILDTGGAEKLLGRGDMLFSPVGASKPLRVQGCFISDEEVEELCEFVKTQGESQYSEDIQKEIEAKAVQDKKSSPFEDSGDGDNLDALFNDAVEVVLDNQKASTSFLQRKLGVGYARGAKIMDQLEEKGIIGMSEGSKPRQILVNKQQWLEMQAYSSGEEFTADNTEQIAFINDEDEEF